MEIEASQKPADTQPLRKRVKAVEPEHSPKPASPEEPRKLDELGKAVFPVGTVWDKMEAVHSKFKRTREESSIKRLLARMATKCIYSAQSNAIFRKTLKKLQSLWWWPLYHLPSLPMN